MGYNWLNGVYVSFYERHRRHLGQGKIEFAYMEEWETIKAFSEPCEVKQV